MLREKVTEIRAGDRVVVASHRIGARRRAGEVVEVIAELGHERCRVRWEDGAESLVYPGPDLTIERRPHRSGDERRRS